MDPFWHLRRCLGRGLTQVISVNGPIVLTTRRARCAIQASRAISCHCRVRSAHQSQPQSLDPACWWRADKSMQRAYSRAPSDASAPVCSPPTRPPTRFLCGADLGTGSPQAVRPRRRIRPNTLIDGVVSPQRRPHRPLEDQVLRIARSELGQVLAYHHYQHRGKATVRNPASDFGLPRTRSPFCSSANLRTTCTTQLSRSTSPHTESHHWSRARSRPQRSRSGSRVRSPFQGAHERHSRRTGHAELGKHPHRVGLARRLDDPG